MKQKEGKHTVTKFSIVDMTDLIFSSQISHMIYVSWFQRSIVYHFPQYTDKVFVFTKSTIPGNGQNCICVKYN